MVVLLFKYNSFGIYSIGTSLSIVHNAVNKKVFFFPLRYLIAMSVDFKTIFAAT